LAPATGSTSFSRGASAGSCRSSWCCSSSDPSGSVDPPLAILRRARRTVVKSEAPQRSGGGRTDAPRAMPLQPVPSRPDEGTTRPEQSIAPALPLRGAASPGPQRASPLRPSRKQLLLGRRAVPTAQTAARVEKQKARADRQVGVPHAVRCG
jgi:hypothetical protein